MRVAFLDDSEQQQPRRRGLGALRAMAAVIFPADQLAPFDVTFTALRSKLGIPPSEEIKWKPPKGSFLAGAGGDLVTQLREGMLAAARDHDARTVTVIIDHGAVYKSKSRSEVSKIALKWLYERVSMHLVDHDDIGMAIADRPGGGRSEETSWLTEALQLTSDGTEYVDPGRVVLPIVTADSRHVPHLQLADLIAATTTGAIAGHPHALALGPRLAELMHRHSLGAVNGAGLKLFPDRYLNLLYHCFGETEASLPSANAGRYLPIPDLPYADDDGLPRAS
ncbi:DUF3800 domain-containing protein [Actinomadura napierensis]|uniref:DUF3800 domain-containing protein n=1 Tax=Actinomadura napierensis TaxID=267854 RepID=A0ABN3AJY9_9ACTN